MKNYFFAVCIGLSLMPVSQVLGQGKLLNKINQATKKVDGILKEGRPTGRTGTEAQVPSQSKPTSAQPKATQQTNAGAPAATVKTNSGKVLLGTGSSPGDISAAAFYVDADDLEHYFHNGCAIVKKGGSTALIDQTGKFILPYNVMNLFSPHINKNKGQMIAKYYSLDGQTQRQVFFEIMLGKQGEKWSYINSQGKVIGEKLASVTERGNYLYETKGNEREGHTTTYTASSGERYRHSTPDGSLPAFVSEVINGAGVVRNKGGMNAYKKMSGQMLTDFIFDEAYAFSDGMALVGKKDAYGQIKYGYIDMDGRQVIPCTFSNKPSDFICGFARVAPKDKAEFEYGYIDKTGRIVNKQTAQDVQKYGVFKPFLPCGLALSPGGRYVMDNNFKIVSKSDFFRSYGITDESWFYGENYVDGERNHKIFFTSKNVENPFLNAQSIGFINVSTRKVVWPVFDMAGSTDPIIFDPVSRLAYARICIGKSDKGQLTWREGYINEDGVFTIMKKKGETW